MLSRISIDVTTTGQSFINIEKAISKDPRDKLLDNFTKALGYTSNWCKIEFLLQSSSEGRQDIIITAITPEQIQDEIKQMEVRLKGEAPE